MKRNSGFTLIELLVTVSIIVLVTGISLSAYLTFNESRQLDVDVRDFMSMVNRIRSKAIFLEYPDDCTGLNSFTFETVVGQSGNLDSVNYYATCSEGRRGEQTVFVLKSSAFAVGGSVSFLPISGATTSDQNSEFTISLLKGSQKSKRVIISQVMDTGNSVVDNE